MELILISNTKLKIMLDESDMKKYHIENECDCAEGSTRRAIRNLLECAKDQIGFNTDGEEIFVQLYASKQGGCELFVTKCNGESKEENEPAAEETLRDTKRKRSDSLPDASNETREKISLPEKITSRLPQAKSRDRARIAYSFSEMSHLIEVCKILRSSGIYPESRAFSDDTGKYYLLLLGEGLKAYSRLDRLTFIVEYGRRENPDCLVSYIAEHGRVICEMKAIETLSAF